MCRFICDDSFNWFKSEPIHYFYVDLDNFLAASNGCANQYLKRKDDKELKGYYRILYFMNYFLNFSFMSKDSIVNPYRLSNESRAKVFDYINMANESNGLLDFMNGLENTIVTGYIRFIDNIKVSPVFIERKTNETMAYMLKLIKE